MDLLNAPCSTDPRLSGLPGNAAADGRFGTLIGVAWGRRTVFEQAPDPARREHGAPRSFNPPNDAYNGTYGVCSPAVRPCCVALRYGP